MVTEETEGRRNPRQKYVHQQGVVTKAKFEITRNRRGYSGIFDSGASDVIIRFSEAGQYLEGVTQSSNPSIALKFLRTGVTSGNQFGMLGFESDPDGGWDFWRKDFKSHLPNFRNAEEEIEESWCIDEDDWFFNHSKVHESECAPLSMGRWMSQVDEHQGFIYQNGNLDLASFDEDGTKAPRKKPVFPFDLEFIPNRDILKSTDSSSRFYKQLVENSADINAGDVLFTVMARNIDPSTGELNDFEEIGLIRQGDSEWTESLWGDERLFFSHSNANNDVRDIKLGLKKGGGRGGRGRGGRGRVNPQRNFNEIFQEMPRFDFWKYELHIEDEDEFEVEEATEQDVIDGMVTTGCPFAFVIDQVNFFNQ